MKKLPKLLKRIIKEKTFSLHTTPTESDWRGGMEIDYRITMVKSDEEDYYKDLTPMNNRWGSIYVNLKVKGYVEMKARHDTNKLLTEISKATQTRANYWGGYDSKYDSLWGNQVNKRVRREIRYKVQSEVRHFLKLMGITSLDVSGDGIVIKKITWEK
tara:strand:+ start:955 stop:1428 length:474 start_codon:yes stop_codon:yes gene_type:complete